MIIGSLGSLLNCVRFLVFCWDRPIYCEYNVTDTGIQPNLKEALLLIILIIHICWKGKEHEGMFPIQNGGIPLLWGLEWEQTLQSLNQSHKKLANQPKSGAISTNPGPRRHE